MRQEGIVRPTSETSSIHLACAIYRAEALRAMESGERNCKGEQVERHVVLMGKENLLNPRISERTIGDLVTQVERRAVRGLVLCILDNTPTPTSDTKKANANPVGVYSGTGYCEAGNIPSPIVSLPNGACILFQAV